MPPTAYAHFTSDVSRARAVLSHATPLPIAPATAALLRGDLLRAAWMFAVGATDAYFCDAYSDLIAATLISKDRHPAMALPEFIDEVRLPVRAILHKYPANPNWRWRMAARRLMERENILRLESVQKLFNKFLRKHHRFFNDLMPRWVLHPASHPRLFGLTGAQFAALPPAAVPTTGQQMLETFEDRYAEMIQRRHDCIHNCDRPRVKPQPISPLAVAHAIDDVQFLVDRCEEHLNAEFKLFLAGCGCPPPIIAQAGY